MTWLTCARTPRWLIFEQKKRLEAEKHLEKRE